jgi:hypothetical protein
VNIVEQEMSQMTIQYGEYPLHVVAQLIEALRQQPEGRGFDSLWCHWNFSFT